MQDLIKAQINIFAFPQCEVSQHILDLFALVEETVREAGDSPSSHSAVRLFGTGLGPLQSHFYQPQAVSNFAVGSSSFLLFFSGDFCFLAMVF